MAEGERLGPVARRMAAAERVLVVEDEHDMAERLALYFRACGYDVVSLDPDSPLAVVAAVQEHDPTCVLLDLTLRGFCGGDAYRALRADGRHAHVPVVVMSARPDVGELLHLEDGDVVATEPCNFNTLADLVADRSRGTHALTGSAPRDATAGQPEEPEQSLSIAM
jgi:DNA-binding response OmpR family regulator